MDASHNNEYGPEVIVRQDSHTFYGLRWDEGCVLIVETHAELQRCAGEGVGEAGWKRTEVVWTDWAPYASAHVPACLAPYIGPFAALNRDRDNAFAQEFAEAGPDTTGLRCCVDHEYAIGRPTNDLATENARRRLEGDHRVRDEVERLRGDYPLRDDRD